MSMSKCTSLCTSVVAPKTNKIFAATSSCFLFVKGREPSSLTIIFAEIVDAWLYFTFVLASSEKTNQECPKITTEAVNRQTRGGIAARTVPKVVHPSSERWTL
jgi:hypothetical protein